MIKNKCFLANYFATSINFLASILDIFISIERLSIFMISFKIFKIINPYYTSIISLFICGIINLPTAFRIYLKEDDEINNDLIYSLNTSTSFFMCGNGPLYNDKFLIGLNIFFRDILTLFFEISLSVVIVVKYRQFQIIKSNLRRIAPSNLNNYDNSDKFSNQDNKLTRMTIYLSIISIISHLAVFIIFVFLIFSTDDKVIGYLVMLGSLSINIKHSINFFIFYNFNSKFKLNFLKIFI